MVMLTDAIECLEAVLAKDGGTQSFDGTAFGICLASTDGAGVSRVAEVRPHELEGGVHGRDITHQRYDEGLLAGMPHQVVGHHLMVHCIAFQSHSTIRPVI